MNGLQRTKTAQRAILIACLGAGVVGGVTFAVRPVHAAGLQDVDALHATLDRVGGRVQAYFDRIVSVICTERVTQQELARNGKLRGKPREFVYDLMLVRLSDDEVQAERELKPGPGGVKSAAARCTDPRTVYRDPLNFLLPQNRAFYRFTFAGPVMLDTRHMLAVDFLELGASAPSVTWQEGCFTANGGRSAGRIWVDPSTFDVVQLESHLAETFEPFDPASETRGAPRKLVVKESTTIITFHPVVFHNPDETLLLPGSIESKALLERAPIGGFREAHTFADYRRFVTDVRIR